MKKKSKSFFIKKLDKIVSEIVRARGYCVKCGKQNGLQCCHIFHRRHFVIRWDLKNLLCLCSGCHIFWAHKEPIEFGEFVQNFLGKKKYIELRQRANTIKKWEIWELQDLYMAFERIRGKS